MCLRAPLGSLRLRRRLRSIFLPRLLTVGALFLGGAGAIGPLFRSALRSAEAQQRAFQRQVRTRERHEVERRGK